MHSNNILSLDWARLHISLQKGIIVAMQVMMVFPYCWQICPLVVVSISGYDIALGHVTVSTMQLAAGLLILDIVLWRTCPYQV